MPSIKKVITIGGSKGVTLDRGWLKLQKQRLGAEIKEVLVTDHMNGLIIVPVDPETKEDPKG